MVKKQEKTKKPESLGRSEEDERKLINEAGRIITAAFHGFQDVRKAMMNQVRDLVRKYNENIPLDQPEQKKEERSFNRNYEDKKLPALLDKLFEQEKLSKQGFIWLKDLIKVSSSAKSAENACKPAMRRYSSAQLIWTFFLSHIPGIGEVLATELIAKMPAWKYDKVSSLWRYVGYHLVCPVCTERRPIRHGVSVEPTSVETLTKDQSTESEESTKPIDESSTGLFPVVVNSEGICPKCRRRGVGPRKREGQNIDYKPKLRTILWNLGESLIKQKSPKYYGIYVSEKKRQFARTFRKGELENMYAPMYRKGNNPYKTEDTGLKKGHAHNRAKRKMVKIFLQHYWVVSRIIDKLPTREPYVQAVLGHTGIITWQDVLIANGQEPPAELVA